MTIAITPLDAPLGATMTGLDLSAPVTGPTLERVRAALDEYLVIVFPSTGKLPTPTEVVEFCSTFGQLRPTLADKSRLADHPAINIVSNHVVDGTEGTGGSGLVEWHSDIHFQPPMIEAIYLDAVKVTSSGGNTRWTNLCAAYAALDAKFRERLEDLRIRCRFRGDIDFDGYFKASKALNQSNGITLSLVQRNPRTGRRSIWPTPGPDLYEVDIVGLPARDSTELLDQLFAHCTEERFVYTHHWQPGDAALWINTQTLHQREAFPGNEERVMRHVNILSADASTHLR